MPTLLYAEYFLIHTGPYVILAALGFAAFARYRTLGTALLGLGLLAYVVGQIAGLFVSADISKTYNAQGQVTSVVQSFHGLAWSLSRYAGTLGMWAAALGAMMHALRSRTRSDPA